MKEKKISLIAVFFLFMKVGLLGLGGSVVFYSLLYEELVKKRPLLNEKELLESFSMIQSLPAPVFVNIAMYAGLRVGGLGYAIVAGLGLIFFPFIIMVLLAIYLPILIHNDIFMHMLLGMRLVVLALVINGAYLFLKQILKTKLSYIVLIISFLLYFVFSWDIVTLIVLSIGVGILYYFYILLNQYLKLKKDNTK